VSAGPGQQAVAASNLVFNGSNPITLPSGLFTGGSALTVSLTFQTTSYGVILGYQNQPLGSTPDGYQPALYVDTFGYLHAKIRDGAIGTLVSAGKVNDGHMHQVVFTETGSSYSLTVDGVSLGRVNGTPQPSGMTYDLLGTGYSSSFVGYPAGYFPFTGTIQSLTIAEGSALAGAVTVPTATNNTITFTPPAAGSYTVGLSSIDVLNTTGSTSQTIVASDIAPTPTIIGLPASGTLNHLNSFYATVTDPIASNTAAGFNDVWSISAGPGQQAVAASNLVFNGSDAVALPTGLIHDATSLTINLSFETTGSGVILGYQNQPLGLNPGNFVPALYVGTNGLLYFELYNGTVQQVVSSEKVTDGQLHNVQISWSYSTISIYFYRQGVNEAYQVLSNFTPQMLDMTYDELGTGYTSSGWPATPGGYFPFTGTIKSLSIIAGATLQSGFGVNASYGNVASFTPFSSGTYTIGLSATDVVGSTGTTSQTFTTVGTVPLPAITGLPANSPEGTAITVTGSATETNATVAAQGFSYLWQATDADGASATGSGALSFNGTSDYVDLGNPTDLDFSGQITLDAWIKPESTSGIQDIVAHGYQLGPDAEDFLRIGGGYYQVGSWNDNGAVAQAAIPASDIGQWVNLAGVYDGTQWILYRDGVQVGTSGPTTQGALPVNNTDWAIGARGTGNERFFKGEIDDVSIWNVGLSPTAVKAAMDAAPSPTSTGLVAEYLFDETGGNTAIDATGNGNNGTLGGINPNNPAAEPSRVAGIVLSPSMTITPGDNGIETVTLQAFDAAGGSGVVTATFTTTDIPVTVNAGTNVVVAQGTPFTQSGSFTDAAGDGPWTATVNYGDDTSPLSMSLTEQTFTLNHAYANAGDFTVTVTVTNREGITGTASLGVVVSGFTINDGNPGPSAVKSLTYSFANPTQVEPGVFELLHDGKPSKIKLNLTPQPDGQTYLITFSGPGVIGGSLPSGRYTLITLHDKVNVLSGPTMTANDVNTFVSRSGDPHGDKKVTGAASKGSGSHLHPPKRAPAKFRGRTVHHHGALRPSSLVQHPALRIAAKALDHEATTAIGVMAPGKLHHH
jgi:hypothetical protein